LTREIRNSFLLGKHSKIELKRQEGTRIPKGAKEGKRNDYAIAAQKPQQTEEEFLRNR
jgi:hypothetical protein